MKETRKTEEEEVERRWGRIAWPGEAISNKGSENAGLPRRCRWAGVPACLLIMAPATYN